MKSFAVRAVDEDLGTDAEVGERGAEVAERLDREGRVRRF
jgi:hypothetical protein